MYLFCNSRIHVITLYSSHVCAVLCVNASVLAPHMDPDYDWSPLLRGGMSQRTSKWQRGPDRGRRWCNVDLDCDEENSRSAAGWRNPIMGAQTRLAVAQMGQAEENLAQVQCVWRVGEGYIVTLHQVGSDPTSWFHLMQLGSNELAHLGLCWAYNYAQHRCYIYIYIYIYIT
jgi:hypothetical protein